MPVIFIDILFIYHPILYLYIYLYFIYISIYLYYIYIFIYTVTDIINKKKDKGFK